MMSRVTHTALATYFITNSLLAVLKVIFSTSEVETECSHEAMNIN